MSVRSIAGSSAERELASPRQRAARPSPLVPSPAASASPAPAPHRRSRPSLLKSLPTLALLATVTIACLAGVAEAASFEPPGDQLYFGAWLDTMSGYEDTPALFNSRLGQMVPVFQFAQEIPLPKYNYTTGAGGAAPASNLLDKSNSSAAVFLTVYPTDGFSILTDADYTALAQQCSDYNTINNRQVFLRYAPEMQGYWNVNYGMRPTEFIASWIALFTIVRQIAPQTILVWAPNTPQGYPYGQSFSTIPSSAADIAALDTNNSTVLDAGDDALAPYYPGDDYVDWIGISLYYKGTTSDVTNSVQAADYCGQAINGTSPADGTAITNWYDTYCAKKPTKACMFAESGAAFHVNDAGVSQAAIQQQWITSCVTNTTLYDTFPRLKMVMQFEYEKVETSNENTQDLRDYRITNASDVLAEFKADLDAIATRFVWATSRAQPISISSAGAPPPVTNSAGSTVVAAITQTYRARPTTFPSLFGTTAGGQRAEVIQLAAIVVSGIAGALTVMKML